MAYIFFNTGGKKYAMNPEQLFHLDPVNSVSDDLKQQMKEIESELLVELFLKDSNERSHAEIGLDLDMTAGQVKMMRHQLGKEKRTPYEKRFQILKKFYLPEVLK